MRIVRTASLRPLRGRQVAILGYGVQGRAQALNLRDNGIVPIIGLPPESRSRLRTRRDRLYVTTPSEAVRAADIVFVLAPDHVHGELFARDIGPHLEAGQMLVFAHASSVHFGLVRPPREVDVVLIAPLGPGRRLRELRGRRDGVPCFLAIHQDAGGNSRPLALALARGIGCLPGGAISTSFAAEAVGDLFGEQAVLCGGLGALLQAGVETLVAGGLKPEAAYLECVYQLDLIVDLIKSEGLEGMYGGISPTAAYGAMVAGPRVIGAESRRAMRQLLTQVTSGKFMRECVKATRRGGRRRLQPTVSPVYRRGERAALRMLRDATGR